MNKDGVFRYIHFNRARDADLIESFCSDKLPEDEINVPPHHQPINPEDEEDVVPDQHAAFGIQNATQKLKEPAWKDLDLAQLLEKNTGTGSSRASVGMKKTRKRPRKMATSGLR